VKRKAGSQIGSNVSLSPDTVLGEDVMIGNNVTIYSQVHIGDGSRILDGAVIGRLPIPAGTTTRPVTEGYRPLIIGERCVIGCNTVLYTGITLGNHVLVADLASIREGCEIGDSVVVGRGAMVLYDARIAARTRIQDQVHIAGNTVIESDVFIGMGVMTANDNDVYLTRFGLKPLDLRGPVIRCFSVVGVNATILPGVEIGMGALVAAGAVVTRDVRAWSVVAGVPARNVRHIPDEQRQQIGLLFDGQSG
jgi:acetyltransferase-like isoleucine patch superfamily enzyme